MCSIHVVIGVIGIVYLIGRGVYVCEREGRLELRLKVRVSHHFHGTKCDRYNMWLAVVIVSL